MSRRSALALLGASALVPRPACPARSSPPDGAAGVGTVEALHFVGVQEIARRLSSREISPIELTRRMLDRIDMVDGTLRSYATVMAEHAIADARAAEQDIAAGRHLGHCTACPWR